MAFAQQKSKEKSGNFPVEPEQPPPPEVEPVYSDLSESLESV